MESPKCKICNESFDLSDHQPLILPSCGHTFCLSCIQKSINLEKKVFMKCPEDHTVR